MATITWTVQGVAPLDVRRASPSDRLVFWRAVVRWTLVRKDWELAMGFNARGKKMPPVLPETRLNRRSEMTWSKRGDPHAPYLTPGRKLSRTRSLLTGGAETDKAVFWWRTDHHGDEWGKILEYHRRRGWQYDVIGLSPKGTAWVAAKAVQEWRRWKAGAYVGSSKVLRQTDVSLTQAKASSTATTYVGRSGVFLQESTRSLGWKGRGRWAGPAGPVVPVSNEGVRATEIADPALLRSLESRGFSIDQSDEVVSYLDSRGANAVTFLVRDILLRPDARKLEVLEEYLHNVQHKIGLTNILSPGATGGLEIHVKEFMLRHRRLLGINEADATWLENWLAMARRINVGE